MNFYNRESSTGVYTPIASITAAAAAPSVQTFSIFLDCRSGYFLKAREISAPEITVEADVSGLGVWENIGTGSADLTAYNGLRKSIVIRITIAALSSSAGGSIPAAFTLLASPGA